jgi:hypothetical protein
MGLLAVASAKGSPGATTTALLFGALWPRTVIVAECDPHGGDVAARLPANSGGVIDADRGLLSLGAAGRKMLRPELVPEHTQRISGGLDVLIGVRMPEQSAGLAQQWGQLGPIFGGIPGYDVIADMGRLGAATPQNVMLASATDLVMVCDTQPSNVVHMRERILALHPVLHPESASGTRIHIAVVADPKRRQAVREIGDAMRRVAASVAEVYHLAYDPKGASFFAGEITGRPDRTALVKSALPVVARLAADTEPFFVEPTMQPMESGEMTQWPGWQSGEPQQPPGVPTIGGDQR